MPREIGCLWGIVYPRSVEAFVEFVEKSEEAEAGIVTPREIGRVDIVHPRGVEAFVEFVEKSEEVEAEDIHPAWHS